MVQEDSPSKYPERRTPAREGFLYLMSASLINDPCQQGLADRVSVT